MSSPEQIADGRGLLVPFADSDAMVEATLRFLRNTELLAETRRRAYRYAKPMFWPNVGQQYLDLFGQVVAQSQNDLAPPFRVSSLLGREKHREELLQEGI